MDLSEQMLGNFCRKGFIREYYDEEKNDLEIKFTDKGIKEIKELLKQKKYQTAFLSELFKMDVVKRNNFLIKMVDDFKKVS